MARAIHRRAAANYEVCVGQRLHRDFIAGLEHQKLPRREFVAADIERAVDQIKRPLFVVGIDRQCRSRPHRDIPKHRLANRRHRRCFAVQRANDDAQKCAFVPDQRKFLDLMVCEIRRHFFLGGRQGDPHLQAVNGTSARAQFGAGALGMNDAAARRHQIDLARLDRRRGAKAVAVHDLAVEQIGDGGKADMWMRTYVQAAAGAEFRRPEWSKKINGPTMRVRADGSARRTEKPSPRSTVRGAITLAMASHAGRRRPVGPCRGRNSCSLLLLFRAAQESVTNFRPFTASRRPLNASFTLSQLGSFFMRSSQRFTFG